jgi:hypothetical protein
LMNDRRALGVVEAVEKGMAYERGHSNNPTA